MKRGAGEVRKRKSEKKSGGETEMKKGGKGKKEKDVKKGKNRKGKSNKGGKETKGKLKKGKKKNNGKKRNGGKSKKKKKTDKKNKKGKRKNKGKKRNKNKIKRKRNKMRGRKDKARREKGNGRQTTTSACSNLTCLTALVSVLKFEKDTVRNFLAQEKRTNNKLDLMKNKQNRSDKYMGTAKFLEKRLGETSAHKSDGPLCKGSYNTSEGIKVRTFKFVFLSFFSGVVIDQHLIISGKRSCSLAGRLPIDH